ncbi:hypothetical protein [Priestia megaterium]|uniref:hypothetical protein n=1 Tax=Priestia megaterium TaxID=1404 RepID=UPI00244C92A3|nr:hypothetical protein [Priestia megaterium]MDH2363958.1 hypothetical protein [Priestia megaterium]
MERKKKQKFEGERIFFFHIWKIEGGKKQQANQRIKIWLLSIITTTSLLVLQWLYRNR